MTLCVRPEQLKAFARQGIPGPNQIPAQLARVVERPHGLRLEFAAEGIAEGIRVNVARGDYECQRDSTEWVIQFPKDGFRVVDASDG